MVIVRSLAGAYITKKFVGTVDNSLRCEEAKDGMQILPPSRCVHFEGNYLHHREVHFEGNCMNHLDVFIFKATTCTI